MTDTTPARRVFEAWLRRARVVVDLKRDSAGRYTDLDTHWLWLAFLQGRDSKRTS